MLKTKTILIFLPFLALAIFSAGIWRNHILAQSPAPTSNLFARSNKAQVVNNQLPHVAGSIVRTRAPGQVKAFAKAKGLAITRTSQTRGGDYLVTLAELPLSPHVLELNKTIFDAKVTPNFVYKSVLISNDPKYADQWNLPKISAPSAWEVTTGNSNVVIAIVDTGVLFEQSWGTSGPFTQPDFPTGRRWENPGENGLLALNGLDDDGNGYVDDRYGWDFMGGFSGNSGCPNFDSSLSAEDFIAQDNDPQPYSCDSPSSPTSLNKNHFTGSCEAFTSACFVGHGTMVASVAAAATNNSQLVAGIDHAGKIMNLRVLDGYGFTTTSRVAEAVEYAASNGADVINLSLAVTDCSNPDFSDPNLEAALLAAKNAGAVTVAASGNEGISNVCYPASSDNAIAVGASNQNDERASFSNYGTKLDIIAPGTNIPVANAPSAAINSNYYPSANGTSLATPHVAGLIGLLKDVAPDITSGEIKSTLLEGADKLPSMGSAIRTNQHGHGRINALKSINLLTFYSPHIRLIQCGDDKYLIERYIKRKRLLTNEAIEIWGMENAFFNNNDKGCAYFTYNLALERLIRSRNTKKEYFTDTKKAYYIQSSSIASAWGFMYPQNTELPQLNGTSIHALNVIRLLPRIAQSKSDNKAYLLDNGNKHYLFGSPADDDTLRLLRGYNEISMNTFSETLLNSKNDGGNINYAFRVSSSWYLFDHGKIRKIEAENSSRWENFLTGPNLSADLIQIWPKDDSLNKGFQRSMKYYIVAEDGSIQSTADKNEAKNLEIFDSPIITSILLRKLTD
jgi:subtilisin family serine protease